MTEITAQHCEIDEDLAQLLKRKQSIVFLEQASEVLYFDKANWENDNPGIPYPTGLVRAKALIREEIEERKKGP